ncbi:hypothetical protein ACOMHN_012785 [Nucella lapillus]
MSACLGANVTLPWVLGSSPPLPGESAGRVEGSIPWNRASYHQLKLVKGDARLPLATYSADRVYSVQSPAYVQHVTLSADGSGLVLSGVTPEDSATYRLLGLDRNGVTTAVLYQLTLTVDGLVSSDGDLHVEMEKAAVWSGENDQWMVSLTCGNFSFPAHPTLDVRWTTPSGVDLTSTNYSEGQFHLHLLPPILGGHYVCRVPHHLFTRFCVPSGGGSQGDGKLENGLWVDEHVTRLLVLEAEHAAVAEDNRELTENQTRLREELRTREEERKTERKSWEEELRKFREELRGVRGEMARVGRVEEERRVEIHQNYSRTVAQLNERMNLLGTTIAFMTQRREAITLSANQRIKFNTVHYNMGNAYSSATGAFTAPLAGTYHFFLKTESYVDKRVCLSMEKDGRRIMYLFAHDAKSYDTPSGSVVVHLQQGQQVWVDTDWVPENLVTVWTTFGGFLVRPDV